MKTIIRARKHNSGQERRASGMQAEAIRAEWITYRQAEEVTGLSRTTLRKLVDEGKIRIRRVGRAVRINRQSLDAYMRGDTEDGTPSPDAWTE
jgi:excisionase family DNA binding protein